MTSRFLVSKTVLPNGVRVLSEYVPYVDSVSIGIWACVGSVDEDDTRKGLSHFVEHMFFKGTEKRTARQLADEMDYLGAHMNAFTDKEYTCYYARVLREHMIPAFDILSDMFLNSVFDSEEIDREKNVVIEEIKRHLDSPEDNVHDVFAQTIWDSHRLGSSVIGDEDTIRALDREKLLSYVRDFYRPDAVVITAAGNVEHNELVDAAVRLYGLIEGKRAPRDITDVAPSHQRKFVDQPTQQVHFCLGVEGYTQYDDKRYALATIDSVLGGGMSSRLFQEIREKRGLAYAIGTYATSYQKGGLFTVYGGTSRENLDTVLELAEKECTAIGRDSVTDYELSRVKNQLRGSLVLGQESMPQRMSRLAKNEINFGRHVRMDEVIDCITKVSKDQVAQVASELFTESNYSLVAIGPFEESSNGG